MVLQFMLSSVAYWDQVSFCGGQEIGARGRWSGFGGVLGKSSGVEREWAACGTVGRSAGLHLALSGTDRSAGSRGGGRKDGENILDTSLSTEGHGGARRTAKAFLSAEDAEGRGERLTSFLSTEGHGGARRTAKTFLSAEDAEGRGERLTSFLSTEDAEGRGERLTSFVVRGGRGGARRTAYTFSST